MNTFRFTVLKPPAYHSCRVNFFNTRVINDWDNLTSDNVENSSLHSFETAVDKYFYGFRFVFIVNVIITSVFYYMHVIEWVYRLFSLNPTSQS